MMFTNPIGLLGLLAVPAVLVMHLFRRRLQRRSVAGLFLWAEQRLTADAGRKRSRLLQTRSLWFEMLAALMAALWLAGPVFGDPDARHVVIVLDNSASMTAVVDGSSARDRAIALLEARVAKLSASDRISVVRTGRRPKVLLGPAAPPGELALGLSEWAPSQPGHSVTQTAQFARELAGTQGSVWWVSDRGLDVQPAGISVCAVGQAAPNAAIASVTRYMVEDG